MATFYNSAIPKSQGRAFPNGDSGIKIYPRGNFCEIMFKMFFYLICVAQIDGRRMHVKGKLQTEESRLSLTANVDGRVFKSWLVDLEGTLHIFTKVHVRIGIWIAALVIAVALVIQSYL